MTNQQSAISNDSTSPWLVVCICLALVLMVALVFGQSIRYGFVTSDDDQNITMISQVKGGLSIRGMLWAFTHCQVYRWTPIATISRQLDCQMFGLWAGGHHITSMLLHASASLVLFFALRSLTGALWRSTFVAALFAIHPLHVEPVVWLSARAEVLAGLFFMISLWAYAGYARHLHSRSRYVLVLLFCILGFLSKPMLVTLPCVLLLLDYWPLGRLKKPLDIIPLAREKIPLFFLSFLVAMIAAVAQRSDHDSILIPLSVRLGNIFVAYVIYIWKSLVPVGLTLVCPLPFDGIRFGWAHWQVLWAALMLGLITTGVCLYGKKKPYLWVGWLWYLVMLLPVIGIVQANTMAYADRYMYLPQIGLCIASVWLVVDWAWDRWNKSAFGLVGCALLVLLGPFAFKQVTVWRNNISLWSHAIKCNPHGCVGYDFLGFFYYNSGQIDEAHACFERALAVAPDDAVAHNFLGLVFASKGQLERAEDHFQKALAVNPAYVDARNNLGLLLIRQGKVVEAIGEYREVLRFNPDHVPALLNLADALRSSGQVEDSIAAYRKLFVINPTDAEALHNLGKLLYQQGSKAEGIQDLKESLRLEPGKKEVLNDLAWMLATAPDDSLRDGRRALELALQADKETGGADPAILDTLAAAYAETGNYPKALEIARKALALAEKEENTSLSSSLKEGIAFYEAGKPCRDPK
jgi:tetratricopeptide (TPR) repeat protein